MVVNSKKLSRGEQTGFDGFGKYLRRRSLCREQRAEPFPLFHPPATAFICRHIISNATLSTMEAITMKTEKDKLEELEDLLADVAFSGEETDEGDH